MECHGAQPLRSQDDSMKSINLLSGLPGALSEVGNSVPMDQTASTPRGPSPRAFQGETPSKAHHPGAVL